MTRKELRILSAMESQNLFQIESLKRIASVKVKLIEVLLELEKPQLQFVICLLKLHSGCCLMECCK